MSAYLLAVLGTILLSAILTGIIPEGKTSAMIKQMTRLACLLVITSPAITLFRNFTGKGIDEKTSGIFSEIGIETDNAFIQYYSQRRIENAERALELELNEKFQITCAVTLYCGEEMETTGDTPIDGILVKIIENNHTGVETAVAEYVKKNYCSEVLIE